ncbi:MAG: tRNA1(Val) (adenine(37)-N6)-methyltransferase [Clostridiales bacterium]|jgi:tRNA1Val (adenine37-N6)-methyltransferase|nr:tRNA1(Val) (adenine(37)-N6)-methyltransferase [Clostridiales bacterium]
MRRFLRPQERLDDLQNNGLHIIQDPAGFCFGSDAVCLTDFAEVRPGERVMDLCTGCGVIPILLSAKTKGKFFTGLEIQPEIADMAQRSVQMNGLEGRVRIDCGDIKQAPELYGSGVFDVVTVNPPYLKEGKQHENPSAALARHEIACTLEDVARISARLLRYGGRLYMVHRPHRLADIFCVLRDYDLEPKALQLVQSAPDKPPPLALIAASLGGKPWLTVKAPVNADNVRF